MASNRGHFLRSFKSSAEVPVFCPLSLVVNFPSGIFKNVYHVEVNMHYLGCLQLRSNLEVLQISCSGHHDQRTPKSATEFTIVLSLAWRSQKGIICRGKYAFFGLVRFGGHQN